jgi:hypothetical protein
MIRQREDSDGMPNTKTGRMRRQKEDLYGMLKIGDGSHTNLRGLFDRFYSNHADGHSTKQCIERVLASVKQRLECLSII